MRNFIFISSGVLFLLIAGVLIFIGSGENDSMLVMLSAAAVPFIFIAFWNIYSVYYERRVNSTDGFYTYKGAGNAGIGVFYNKVISIPLFLILFGSAALAIAASFLASNRSTFDFAVVVLALSILYSLAVTLYFIITIGKSFKSENTAQTESPADDFGFKVAFFFASVATLGLFPLVYFLLKSKRRK